MWSSRGRAGLSLSQQAKGQTSSHNGITFTSTKFLCIFLWKWSLFKPTGVCLYIDVWKGKYVNNTDQMDRSEGDWWRIHWQCTLVLVKAGWHAGGVVGSDMDVCEGKAMEGLIRVVGQVWVIVILLYKLSLLQNTLQQIAGDDTLLEFQTTTTSSSYWRPMMLE